MGFGSHDMPALFKGRALSFADAFVVSADREAMAV